MIRKDKMKIGRLKKYSIEFMNFTDKGKRISSCKRYLRSERFATLIFKLYRWFVNRTDGRFFQGCDYSSPQYKY